MNEPFILSCCSTVDLTPDLLEERHIHYAHFHYFLNEKEYADDMGQTISMRDFYQAMVDGADARTAQINAEEYCRYFTPFLEAGQDVLHLTLSSGISGSYNSARIAAETLQEQFPERRIRIVDSLGASSGSGLFIMTLADLRDKGKSLDELYAWAETHKREMHHWFYSSDLTFYVKGGRVTKAAGWFGTVLKICPVLNMDVEGRLIPRLKVRGKQNAMREIVRQMEQHANNGTEYAEVAYISHSDCPEDANRVASMVRERFPHVQDVRIFNIGPTIGCHSGPGTVALYFWGDARND